MSGGDDVYWASSSPERYVTDAQYTLDSLARDLISRMDAGSYISEDDWDAYERAEQAVKDVEALWSGYDGVLVPYARQRQYALRAALALRA